MTTMRTRRYYDRDEAVGLAMLAEGKASKFAVDPEILRERLNAWLHTNGLLDPSCISDRVEREMVEAYREFATLEPTLTDNRKCLERLIDLSSEISNLLKSEDLPPGLNAQIARSISSQKGKLQFGSEFRKTLAAGDFRRDLSERMELLNAACDAWLPNFKTPSKRGRPQKGSIDDLVWQLADIFIELTGQDCHVNMLPAAHESIFIRWASKVLRPHLDRSESSRRAISGRWQRLTEIC